jgi:hypothetical protein
MGNGSNYTSPLSSSNNLNQSQNNGTSQNGVGSPKLNKDFELNYEEAKNLMMKKRSPVKNDTEVSMST